MSGNKMAQLKTHGEVVADEQARDEEFSREWERLAFARAVAANVIGYRADHDLSQRDLAEILEVPQPQVTRLESGEVSPSEATLIRLASKLEMEFTINIAPAARDPKQITKTTRERAVASYARDKSVVRYGAA